MDKLYKDLGLYKEGDPIDYVSCTVCGVINEIPLYINFGRFCPAIMWCWKCGTSFKYWRYYGCHEIGEIEGWTLHKVIKERTKGKIIEKEF